MTGTNILKQQLQTSGIEIPSVTFELEEQETKPTPNAGKRGKVARNLREENEDNAIGQESLTVRVDTRKRKRVTFDLKDQEISPTPRARKRDRVAKNPRKKNKENVIGQESLTVRVDVHEPRGVTFDLEEMATNATPKARKRDRVAENPRKKADENVIGQGSLTVRVDVHEPRRVTFDRKEQAANPTSNAGKPDEVVVTLSEENEEYLTCQESLTVDVYEGGRITHSLTEQEANPSPEEGQPGAERRDVEDTWL